MGPQCVFVVLLLLTGTACGEGGHHKHKADSLAVARISDAVRFLGEINPESVHQVCKRQLQPFEVGLLRAQEFLKSAKESDALEELNVVEAGLDGCLAAMKGLISPHSFQSRALLRNVASSISTAQELVEAVHTQSYTIADFSRKFPQAVPESRDEAVDKLFSISSGNSRVAPSNTAESTSPAGKMLSDVLPAAVQQYLPAALHPGETQVSDNNAESSGDVPFQPNKPSFEIDYCANHVELKEDSVSLHLDRACGARFHTAQEYTSGVFSAMIKTPVKADGVSSSFSLSSDGISDSISFDFYGNTPKRVSTSYRVLGEAKSREQKTFAVRFDTSASFHKYTIKWDADSIMWLVDDVLYRTIGKSRNKLYPTKPSKLYGLIWDASHVGNGAVAGTVDWNYSPFNIDFNNIVISSPLKQGTWKPPPQPSLAAQFMPSPMRPLAIDYCGSNIDVGDNDITLKYDSGHCGGRVRSISRYPSGTFTANMMCASGETGGLVSRFYLSSLEGSKDQDEIGFTLKCSEKRAIRTSFVVNGEGNNEEVHDLQFDGSQEFHKYGIKYNKQQLQWLVDDKVVRTVTFSQQALVAGTPYPVKLMYVYASVSYESSIDYESAKWHGLSMPYKVTYRDITVKTD